MPSSEMEKIFRAFAEERKAELPRFTPDGIPIMMENKFDDAIYNYLYAYWKEHLGEYDPKKDVIPESEMNKMHPKTKNEFQFEKWLFEQYGMTSKEKTENTLMGNLNVLLEVSDVIDIAALPVGAIAVGAKLVGKKVIKEVGEKAVKEVAEEAVEKTVKKETAEEVAENTGKDTLQASNSIKEKNEVWDKDFFRKNADSFYDVMGSGINSHPEQWKALLNEMKNNGVEIIYREGAIAYSPAKGSAGQLVVDPNASYSALLHEYTHYLDDAAAGFPGMEYHFQTINRVKMELHAYMQEIKLADSLGYKDIANQLFENYRIERELLTSHLK